MSERPTPETDAVEFQIADSNHFAVHVIYARKLERERDEARELCRELADLVAYGLGQSGEPWSFDAMRKATYAIQKVKTLEGEK